MSAQHENIQGILSKRNLEIAKEALLQVGVESLNDLRYVDEDIVRATRMKRILRKKSWKRVQTSKKIHHVPYRKSSMLPI